jgi:hypothetical protein
MKEMRCVVSFLLLLLLATAVWAQTTKGEDHLPSKKVIEDFARLEERLVTGVAEAMPADKYPFTPTNGEFKGVRTFAEQLKHIAADNYMLGAGILGENPPADVGDETGPDSLRTKADVIEYVKSSFTYLHRAVASIDDNNAVIASPPISPLPKGSATRLGLAVEVLLHTFDHYGQLVEYLRMNGIVPPASRLDSGASARAQ